MAVFFLHRTYLIYFEYVPIFAHRLTLTHRLSTPLAAPAAVLAPSTLLLPIPPPILNISAPGFLSTFNDSGNSSDCSHGSSCGSCASNGRTLVNECNSSGANGNCSTCGSPTYVHSRFSLVLLSCEGRFNDALYSCNCTSCAC